LFARRLRRHYARSQSDVAEKNILNFIERIVKKIFSLILIFFTFLGVASFALAQDNEVNLYFFYGDTCPHCKKAEVFLGELKEKYPSLKINSYEVFGNKENAKLLLQFFENCGEEKTVRVPSIFIGQEVIIGYLDNEITGRTIERAVKKCLEKKCPDPLKKVDECQFCQCQGEQGEVCSCQICTCPEEEKQDEIISFPFIGQINLSKLSLPVLTVVVAALDGFNPCAMWVLLFLIALLVNIGSRKKIWLVGGTFIAASGIVYYLLLSAWLNLFLAISYVSLTRIIIGLLAIGAGIWQVKNFLTYKPGVCEVTPIGSKWHERLSEKAKQIVQSTAWSATFVGIIVLALGVNLIEFFCSAGLPAIYTRILSLSQLSSLNYYLYLLLYTFIFMLDDLTVFTVAVITLNKIGFTEKYTKWSTLIGGLLILILGLLLIFKPDFLVFGA
jgi:thiol-disulfide isomerase/thioredoxin